MSSSASNMSLSNLSPLARLAYLRVRHYRLSALRNLRAKRLDAAADAAHRAKLARQSLLAPALIAMHVVILAMVLSLTPSAHAWGASTGAVITHAKGPHSTAANAVPNPRVPKVGKTPKVRKAHKTTVQRTHS